MPGDVVGLGSVGTPAKPPRWAWLRSQGFGLILGQASVLLLAVGSIVIAWTRDGLSKNVQLDDIAVFFEQAHWGHSWFYLLLPVMTLYAINTLLCTWDSVIRKWRTGVRAWVPYAAAIIHVGFLVAMLAHLIGGIWGEERGMVMVGSNWSALGDGRHARVAVMEVDTHPDGSTRQVYATLQVRDRGGRETREVVSYNGPLSGGFGRDLFLLARQGQVPAAARLRIGSTSCRAALGATCSFGTWNVQLLELPTAGRGGMAGMGGFARVRLTSASSLQPDEAWLRVGRSRALEGSNPLVLDGIDTAPALMLRRRHAPGNPWALLSAVIMLFGIALMWRRFI